MNKPLRELFFVVESARKNDHLIKGKVIPFKTAYRYYNQFTGNRIHSFIKSFVDSLEAMGVLSKENKEITIFLEDYAYLKKEFPEEFKDAIERVI